MSKPDELLEPNCVRIDTRQDRGARLRLLALVGATLLAAPFATADVGAAKASPVACYALERNCLTHAAKSRQFLGKLESNASTLRQDSLDSFCYDSSAQARHAVSPGRTVSVTP